MSSRSFVAYVPQDPSAVLNPSFTVASQMIDMIIWYESDRRLAGILRETPPPRRRRARPATMPPISSARSISPIRNMCCGAIRLAVERRHAPACAARHGAERQPAAS